MWTIRFAERLRFPRVPSVEQLAAWERGEMLAFAHIPAGPAATAMSFDAGEEEDPRSRRALPARGEAQCRGSMQVRTLRRRYSSSRRP